MEPEEDFSTEVLELFVIKYKKGEFSFLDKLGMFGKICGHFHSKKDYALHRERGSVLLPIVLPSLTIRNNSVLVLSLLCHSRKKELLALLMGITHEITCYLSLPKCSPSVLSLCKEESLFLI